MADSAEVTEKVAPTTTEEVVEKKVVDVESDEKSSDAEPKENGESAKNGKDKEAEPVVAKNGISKIAETTASKRKSDAADTTDTATVEGTPEKKAKVAAVAVSEESEESNSTNGSAEVAA